MKKKFSMALSLAMIMALTLTSLALAAGMLPAEYRQLCQLDPLAEMAEQKGRADNEREISQVLNNAALGGDAKAAASAAGFG